MNDTLFRRKILRWYAPNARSLPWRGTLDPYRVWVSEIMLQQTTTQTVQGFFDRFMDRFPTIRDLAAASLDEVNRLWEGLGYYRRAAQLHRAAQEIVERWNGVFPMDIEIVRKLPGIGRYTAGAILSIAADQRLPILEANTLRLHARLLAVKGDPAKGETNRVLWEFAERILPKTGCGRFNQALMDLGSLVCTPKTPRCSDCPVVSFCAAAKRGLQTQIPTSKTKEKIEERKEIAVLVRKKGKVLLIRYPSGVRWAGLWDFPRCEFDEMDDKTVQRRLSSITGRNIVVGRQIKSLRHSVTRYRITLQFHEAQDCGKETGDSIPYETRWATIREIEQIPLNSTARKLWNYWNTKK